MSQPITLPAPVIELTAPPRTKWEPEYQAFQRLLPHLLATHGGQYVAIHEGHVVDSGDDKLALALRILAIVGNVAIHVGLVTEGPEPIYRWGFAVRYGRWRRHPVIRYNDIPQFQPPAPFVYVTLRNPVSGSEQRDVPAQLDSAETERYCGNRGAGPGPSANRLYPRWRGGRHHPNNALLSCAGGGPRSRSSRWLPALANPGFSSAATS